MPAIKTKPATKESSAIVQEHPDALVPLQPENAEEQDEPVLDANVIMKHITDSDGNIALEPCAAAKTATLKAAPAKPSMKEIDIKLKKVQGVLAGQRPRRRVL